MKKSMLALLAAACLSIGLRTGVAAEPAPEIDWQTYYAELPGMKEISDKSNASIHRIHDLVTGLKNTTDERKSAELRAELRKVLEAHRALKVQAIEAVDRVLHRPAATRTDQEALRVLRNTTLRRVGWRDQALKFVIRDLSEALELPIRLSAPVQELHNVTLSFPEVRPESVLNIICQNFELKWIIYGGEVIVYRALNRSEERFLEYEKKHGKIDWIAEDKKNTYETIPVDKGKRELEAVENMDLPLLEGNLTKLYILEGESGIMEVRLKELEIASAAAERRRFERGDTPEAKAASEKRRKHIHHYVMQERDNAVEVWSILNEVLGIRLQLEDGDPALQALLSKEVAAVNWRETPLPDALLEVGRLLGVKVEYDLPKRFQFTVNLQITGITGEVLLQTVCDLQPLAWKFENGVLKFVYVG